MADVSISLRAKRKRGRPRKDSILCREPENSTLTKTQRVEVTYPTPDGITKTQEADKNSKDGAVDGVVGSVVYGVIEGSFDAGYLISVRIGNNQTPFRGVVFQPRKFVPITAANDIAPQAKMYHRREIPVPAYDNLSQNCGFSPHSLQPVQATKQAVLRPVLPSTPLPMAPYSSSNQPSFTVAEATMMRTSSCSNMGGQITMPRSPNSGVCKQFSYLQPTGSLRMVEEDDVMQAFEVSTSKNNMANSGDVISESLFQATTNSFPGKESITDTETHNKLQGSGSNVEIHHNLVENMPQSAFETQRDEMICRDGKQNTTIQLQDIAQSHSVSRDSQAKTELQQPTNLYYNELSSPTDVNFHQDLFTGQSLPDSREPKSLAAQFHAGDFIDGVSKSPNLKLDLAFTAQEKNPSPPHSLETNYSSVLNGMKSPNLGFHQALVAGNPLLLPPDLISEPLEFMMEKPKSPANCKTPQESSLEPESRVAETAISNAEGAATPSASYKLELATPQSSALNVQTNSSSGCIVDMDFVLGDAIRPAESLSCRSDSTNQNLETQ